MKREWKRLGIVLLVFAVSLAVTGIFCKREWASIDQRHLAKTELNAHIACDYFKREMEDGVNVAEAIDSGVVGNSGAVDRFAKTARYMIKKYPNIHSVQLIYQGQTVRVRRSKTEQVPLNLQKGSQADKDLNYCRRKRLTGIIGPAKLKNIGKGILICKPIFIKGHFWGYTVVMVQQSRLFKKTFNNLDRLSYYYRLSKTHVTGGDFQQMNSTMGQKPAQASVTFKLGGCSWKLETCRKDAGTMPGQIKGGLALGFTIAVVNSLLACLLLNYIERGKNLAKLVNTDYLTGLMSRQAFDRDASKHLESHPSEPAVGAIIDIDDFKYINDLYGHEAGDEALKAVAQVLRADFGGQGLVCRNGGDEFAVLLPDTTLTEGRAIFQKLYRHELTFVHNGKKYPYTVSLGFAAYPEQGKSREELLNRADMALYAIKSTGKGTMAAYSENMLKEGRSQLGFNLRDLAVNLPGAFFIYRQEDEKILFANKELLNLLECDNMEEFIKFVGRSFKGLLAPEDYERKIASRNAQIGDGDEGRATLDYHVITRKTHRRLKMHAVAHMVKNPYFGKIYYVILGSRGEEAD